MRGGGLKRGQAQVAYVNGARGSAPCGRPHRKLRPTDIVLSSHAEKLAFLGQNFIFGRSKVALDRIKWKYFVNIN